MTSNRLFFVAAIVLTIALVAEALYHKWIAYRCRTRGHRWEEVPCGFRCRRCQLVRVGADWL